MVLLLILLLVRFYINYEECKSKLSSINSINCECFILTMRNVNTKGGRIGIIASPVLY